MSFLEKCKELFGKDDLYSIFGLTKDATEKQSECGFLGIGGAGVT